MSSDESTNDELIENIKILATDDKKIKSFGEIFTNDSSREILQLLFNEELTATQIAQKSDISLQLVKYHLNKLQDLGVVKISKVEKNSKSQDMKIYTASKFSIVIVPPTLSEKTKESKLLVRSFRHIYKVTGLGIASGVSGLFSLSQIRQSEFIQVDNSMSARVVSSVEDFSQNPEVSEWSSSDSEESIRLADESVATFESPEPASTFATPTSAKSEPEMDFDSSADLTAEYVDLSSVSVSSNELTTTGLTTTDFFIPLLVITGIFSGFTIYYLYKFFKKS